MSAYAITSDFASITKTTINIKYKQVLFIV